MFFDSDKKNATDSSSAKYEIMVWFAHFGNSAQTIGNNSGNGIGVINTHTVNNTELYVLSPFHEPLDYDMRQEGISQC